MHKNITTTILIVIILITSYLLFFNEENWIGVYYPDKNNLTKYIQSSKLNSLEECRFWINSQIPIHNPSNYGYDYECGKNCKFDEDLGVYVCKETLN